MSRVLVIGAAVEQLPAIKRAKELGYYVGVVDYNPEAVGIPYADVYYSYSTIDEEGILEAAQDFNPECILTLATDKPIVAVANATTKLGLPGISKQSAIKATDKVEMIKAFQKNKVEIPWFLTIKDADELKRKEKDITYPCIIKPVDNAASRGVILVNCREEINDAYSYSISQSNSGVVIIEEYMQGNELSVEIVVVEGIPYILAITDKLTTGAPHFVELGHSQPTILDDYNVNRIKDLAIRAVKAIEIDCGPAHVEIILTQSGPKMVELGARMGGDCITSHLVKLSTGINMIDVCLDVLSGKKADLKPKFKKGSAIRFLTGEKGVFSGLNGVREAMNINGVEEVTMIMKPGDIIEDINSSDDRVGYIISQSENAHRAIQICEKVKKSITVY